MTKCKICKAEFVKRSMTHKCCSPECAEIFGKEQTKKQLEKKEREETKRHKQALEEARPLQYHLKLTEAVFNRAIRLRDEYFGHGCISCDKTKDWDGQWHASHYKSVGSNSALRFHWWNVHRGCSVCNNWLSGNIAEYEKRLPIRIGQERFEWLQTQRQSVKYTREYLKKLRRVFSKVCRRYERLIRRKNAHS